MFVPTAADLAQVIGACASNQAIALGALRSDLADLIQVTVKRKVPTVPGAIARTREFINYRSGEPGWALIDFDKKGMPPEISAAIERAGGMWLALLAVAPGLERAERVSRASTSAGLFNVDAIEEISGSGGAHHYILVEDAADIERFLRDLHDRCWLGGLAWYRIGAVGQLLDRSLVDRMVAYGERLCFEGPPTVKYPLAQDAAARKPEAVGGESIDSYAVVPPLTEHERQAVDEAKQASRQALSKEAAAIRRKHDMTLAEKIAAKSDLPLITAQRLVEARHRGVLLPYIELEFDDLGTIPVIDVLADPSRFIGETLADPLEGVSYGPNRAIVMQGDDGGLLIHSFVHGGALYRLRHDLRSAKAAIACVPADSAVDIAMTVLASSEMEPDEEADFTNAIAAAAKIGVRPIRKRIAKERLARAKTGEESTGAPSSDKRLVRERPDPDGELTPIVTLLDELLSKDPQEEPPMRNVSGKLVEVRVREPWQLHRLTADGTNADSEGSVLLTAPAEPSLAELTPIGTEMLIERYVRWKGAKHGPDQFYATPPRFVGGLMEYSRSAIPTVRMINTAPLGRASYFENV